jgi:hypothetical protein
MYKLAFARAIFEVNLRTCSPQCRELFGLLILQVEVSLDLVLPFDAKYIGFIFETFELYLQSDNFAV